MYLFKKEDMDRSINVNNPSVIKFISDITRLIANDGILVFEVPYWLFLVKKKQCY